MISRSLGLFLVLILTYSSLSAQKVTTLLNDPFRQFAAMHWHEDGRIYAVDYFQGRVYQVYLDGTVKTLVSGLVNLAGGGFDQQGRFYFSGINTGVIYRLNDDNSYSEVASGFNQPVGILASREEEDILYVTEFGNSKVSKLSISTGEVTTFASGGGISGPDAIQYDWSGENFLVSNWNNHRVHTIDKDGNVSFFALVPEGDFMGYIDRIGDYLYVPSFSSKTLYRIDQQGNATLIAGNGQKGYDDGEGKDVTFTKPNGTCHNPAGDTLLVSDHNTIRIVTNLDPTVGLRHIELEEVSISPNPSADLLNISFVSEEKEKLEWVIYDREGRMMIQGVSNDAQVGPQSLQIPIQQLIPGWYTVKFLQDGRQSIPYSFIKNEE